MTSKLKYLSFRCGFFRLVVWGALPVLSAASMSTLADVIIDPFNEGNDAVSGYTLNTEGEPSFYAFYAGAERLVDNNLDPGAPGFGDVLIDGGSVLNVNGYPLSYIGLGEGSRGRLYLEGAGTEFNVVSGFNFQGESSVLNVTDGAKVYSGYPVDIYDPDVEVSVSGSGSLLTIRGGESTGGGRIVTRAGGGGQLLVSDGGRIDLRGGLYNDLASALSYADLDLDFEISGAGSVFESEHRVSLHSASGRSVRVLDGGRIVQSDDFNDLENLAAFSFDGGDSYESGLIVSGFGSRIDLINDAVLGDSGFATLSDGGSLNTEGSVLIEGSAPGAMQVLMDDGRIKAGSGLEIAHGAKLTGRNDSLILGDVEVGYGVLRAEETGLTIEGDLNVNGTLELEVGESPALAVAGTTLFGPDSYLRLLLSAVPSGDILVDDYLLADVIDFDPMFSLAAQLDIQFDDDVSPGAEFTIAFAGLDQTARYRDGGVVPVPELDGATLPMAIGLLFAILGLRREYRLNQATPKSCS